jgi:hypothetical protein
MPRIRLDRERNIRFNLAACKKFKELTGKSLLKMTTMTELDEEQTIALIYCGLMHEDKELTLDKVADMVDTTNLIETLTAVSQGLNPTSAKTEEMGDKTEEDPLVNTGLSASSISI